MKKKNLAVLLIIPFLFSVLTTVTINATYIYVDVDISGIAWDYGDPEAFKLNENGYKLNATGVNQRNYTIAEGNELVWRVEGDNEGEPIAEIERKSDGYYLKTLSVGAVNLICSNQKGNVSRKLEAIIYDRGFIIAKSEIKPSGANYDPNIYYGQYDMDGGGNLSSAKFRLNVTTQPSELKDALEYEFSDNIEFDAKNYEVTVKSAGDAFVRFKVDAEGVLPYKAAFKVVENGVNVYNYEQLLNCTNRSENGEIVVLRKSFQSESFLKTELGKENNVTSFGKKGANGKYSFASEIYSFKTKYNHEYIDKWNQFAGTDKRFSPISDKINVGLRVRKDFYGNGYTVNFHNLTYPYETVTTGDGQEVPVLTADNLFRGPLPFYTLGDPNGMALITAYGQDNAGFYIDGDGITVNDVIIKNCDDVNSLKKLETVGTAVEADGNDITVKNCTLSNGKNVLRSFSSYNFTVDNCLMMHAQNFLFTTGANEYSKPNGNSVKNFSDSLGKTFSAKISDYMKEDGKGDVLMTEYLGNIPKEKLDNYKTALRNMQNALGDESVKTEFKGSTEFKNCQFYDSGISSIVFESLFNGPFLYSKIPSQITKMFSSFSGPEQKPLIPDPPEQISGTSYPVKVIISGDTAFYDYKNFEKMDISGLINENISTVLKELSGSGGLGGITGGADPGKYEINIDFIFPLKSLVKKEAQKRSVSYSSGDAQYTNIPIAYYGGGANYSTVEFATDYVYRLNMKPAAEVDIMETYLNMSTGEGARQYYNMMLKTVTIVTGYEPFRFVFTDGATLGQTPSVEKMQAHAKGV